MHRLLKAALVAIAILSVGLNSPASAQTALPVIRVTAGPYDSYAEAYYAEAQGFFKKAGLDVRIESFTSGEKMALAVAGGASDIGLDNPIHLALGMAHGANFVVIGGSSLYSNKSPSTALLIEKNSPIKTAKDLENSTVAISGLKNIQELGIKAWLSQNGADIAKIRFVELPTAEMGAAVGRGTVAAALVAEPFFSVSLKNSPVRVLSYPFDSVAPQFYISTWFTTPAYLKSNPDLVKRFMAAIYESAKWANTHMADTGQILVKVAKIDPDTLQTMRRTLYAEDMRASGLQPQLDIGYKYGVLDKPTTFNEMMGR
jgi:NitT/TauT family transport system substrate-binding protein